jgi:hypothetical protein
MQGTGAKTQFKATRTVQTFPTRASEKGKNICGGFLFRGSVGSALMSGENRHHLWLIQMIQCPLYQQMRPLSHATDRQGY